MEGLIGIGIIIFVILLLRYVDKNNNDNFWPPTDTLGGWD